MRRADRLFDIIQILRRGRLVRAADLAAELEVSERTIYRDIATLMAAGVPVEGEAGVGYVLRPGLDLPPLMFTETELEALVLGARIVRSWADDELARAAYDALAKVEAVLPERLRARMAAVPLDAPLRHYAETPGIDLARLRRAIRERRKVGFAYTDLAERLTERTVCPLLVSFFGPVWTLTAWCELRDDFRMFRLDRIAAPRFLEQSFGPEHGRALQRLSAAERR